MFFLKVDNMFKIHPIFWLSLVLVWIVQTMFPEYVPYIYYYSLHYKTKYFHFEFIVTWLKAKP